MDVQDIQILFIELQSFLAQLNLQYPVLVPLIGIVISFVQVYLFFIPTMIIVAMNTVIFGPLIGFFVSLIGIVLGTYSFFVIFRHQFGNTIWQFINRFKISHYIKAMMKRLQKRGFLYITMLYGPLILIVSPVPVTIAAGLSKVDKKTYVRGLICGEAIMIAMATFLGTGITKVFENPVYLVLAVVMIVLVTFVMRKIQQRWDAGNEEVKEES